MNAASSGPSDDPKLPPVWKSDCANPCRPPDASRAMRDDSGWKIDDADADERGAEEQHREAVREGEHEDARQHHGHADGERVRPRRPIGVKADHRLQHRRRDRVRHRDHPDLPVVEPKPDFSIG